MSMSLSTVSHNENKSEAIKVEIKSKPKLGLLSSASYLFGNVVGSGIFVSPTFILQQANSVGACIAVWIACGLVSILGSLCLLELGTSIPKSGSDYAYIYHVKWKSLAFGLALVNMFITWPASIAVLSATFGEYAMQAIDPWVCVNSDSDKKAVQLLIAICFTLLITYLNFGQLNKSLAIFQNITTLCKIVTSLVICGAGGYYYFFKNGSANFIQPFYGSSSSVNAYILASYGGFWAYTGYDALNSGIEEVHNPRRTLPLAVTGGLIVITIFYALINVAYISVLGVDGMLSSIAVGQTFTNEVFGRAIALSVPFLIGIMIINAMNATFFTGSRFDLTRMKISAFKLRLMFAIARNGQLPRFLSILNINTNSPQVSVTLHTLITILLLLFDQVELMLNLTVFTIWLNRTCSLFAIIYIRVKHIEVHKDVIKVPIAVHVTFLLICLALVIIPFVQTPVFSIIGLGIVVIGTVGHFALVNRVAVPNFVLQIHHWLHINAQKLFLSAPEIIIEDKTELITATIVERF